jgi:hypothetical protein
MLKKTFVRCHRPENQLFAGTNLFDALNGFNHIEPEKTQRYVFTEHGDEKQFIIDFRKMYVALLAFVEQEGEFLLTDKFRHGVNSGKISGSQCGKGVDVIF